MVQRDGAGSGAGTAAVLDVLAVVRERVPLPVAPHVAQALATALAGDADAVVETAGLLTQDQLAGLALVPDPLPVAPTARCAVEPALAGTSDVGRRVLLIAAVQVVDRTDALLRAAGLALDDLLADPVVGHLDLVAGHVRIRDPRVRSVVHEAATVAERTAAHRALAAVHAQDGNDDVARWHRALACLAGDPAVAPGLVATAERMLGRGDAVWAQRVAREAMSHADGAAHAAAVAVAGRAALHAGHVAEAADLLREAVRTNAPAPGNDLRTALLVAVSHHTGQVPQELVDRDGSTWSRLVAAVLHAARGDAAAAGTLCGQEGAAVPAPAPDGLELATATIAVLTGRAPVLALPALTADDADPVRRAMVASLRAVALAAEGRVDAARGVLAAVLTELAPLPGERAWTALSGTRATAPAATGHDPGRRPGAMTPLVEAHVRLVESLLEAWAGNVDGAASVLTRTAARLPVGLCLGGAAAVVAGRASVLAHGEPGVLSDALERLVPLPLSPAVRTGLLTDRALGLLIEGDPRGAATLLGLCAERSCPGELPLPTLRPQEARLLAGESALSDAAPDALGAAPQRGTVTGPTAGGPPWAPASGGASGLAVALVPTLAARLDLATREPADLDAAVDRVLRLDRAVVSPVERGVTRLVVGQALARAGRQEEGREHLRAAVGLLEGGGAHALAGLVRRIVQQAGTARAPLRVAGTEAARPPRPALVPPDGAAWAGALTEREVEVALVIADGASNRLAARRLGLSERTVEVHLTSIFRKLGVASRTELALLVSRAERAV